MKKLPKILAIAILIILLFLALVFSNGTARDSFTKGWNDAQKGQSYSQTT